MKRPRLGVNIDHVATVRNARGGSAPDPIRAATIAKDAGADGITAHLREDRRHIKDDDIQRLMTEVDLPLNFEMAATEEMKGIAIKLKPNAVCIVPENRMEITTEGGLNVIGQFKRLKSFCEQLNDKELRTSLFIEPDTDQINKVVQLGVPVIELHAGSYCDAEGTKKREEFLRIEKATKYAHDLGLECHVGHGLNYENVGRIASIDHVAELNIGHFLIGESLFLGLEVAIRKMNNIIDEATNIN
jgi:pyridoxine 5-phosphate synthase